MAKSKKKNKKKTPAKNHSVNKPLKPWAKIPLPVQHARVANARIVKDMEALIKMTEAPIDTSYVLADPVKLITDMVDLKYKTNIPIVTMSFDKSLRIKDLPSGEQSAIGCLLLALGWYKYSKTMYKISEPLINYIDEMQIPDNYEDILHALPQQYIYVDLRQTDIMSYNGEKMYGLYVNTIPHVKWDHEEWGLPNNGEYNGDTDIMVEYTFITSRNNKAVFLSGPMCCYFVRSHIICDHKSDEVDAGYYVWFSTLVLKILLYLGITKPHNTKISTKHDKNIMSNTPIDHSIIDLDELYREGAVFDPHKIEKNVYEKDGESENTGNHIPPHIRAGHWQTYWTGKGRTVPVQKFVKECFVNCDDASKLPTVGHVVKKDE